MSPEAVDMYEKLRRAGAREGALAEGRGEDPYLISLSDRVPGINKLAQKHIGMVQIELSSIAGTMTSGRQTAFSRTFKPLLAPGTEFHSKWVNLYDAVVEEGLREPVKAYEYYNKYYILQGNKRVSVMNALDAVCIEADVTRILPEKEDSPRYRAYQAYLSFYADVPTDRVVLDTPSAYAQLYALADKTPGEPWTEDETTNIAGTFVTFRKAYTDQAKGNLPMSMSAAFLLFLKAFGYDACMKMMSSEIAESIRRMWVEFEVATDAEAPLLLDKPSARKPSVIKQLLRTAPQQLKVAFVYNSSPEKSGWTYWHELARQGLQVEFPGKVTTTFRSDVTQDTADEVIDELVHDGWDVIFACSPVFGEACIHQSLAHPGANILSSSLMADYHHVRSYYLRVYEAKFVMGAIAGAMTANDKIGYIADYPIYGAPASINAFALGAQMTNPRARILLEWSSVKNSQPEAALARRGADIISGRDISAPFIDTRAFGLYNVVDGQENNLAMPVWNWARLYADMLQSIMNGTWQDDAHRGGAHVLSYYTGMAAGAIDVITSQRLPAGLNHLAHILKEQVKSGKLHPFSDALVDQSGVNRIPDKTIPTQNEIIRMDYLLNNVQGEIPDISKLNEAAQRLVAIHGLRSADAAAADAAEIKDQND